MSFVFCRLKSVYDDLNLVINKFNFNINFMKIKKINKTINNMKIT